jgi:hypothetical protein
MQNVEPLESWGMNKGRFGQPGADWAAFCVLKNVILRCDKSKMMGGRWNPDVKLWYIQYGYYQGTGVGEAYNIGYLYKMNVPFG